jgi:hypothetical protein
VQDHAAVAAGDHPHDAVGVSAGQALHGHHPVLPADVTAHEAAASRLKLVGGWWGGGYRVLSRWQG